MKLMSARHAAGAAAALLVTSAVLAGGAGARPAAIGAQPVVTGLANIVSETPVYTHGSAVLSVQAAPDGTLYFSTPGGIFRLVLT
jgi:hypothetical protein